MIKPEILSMIPIIGMVARNGESRGRPLVTRLVESSLPGVAVALILMYSSGKVNEIEITTLKSQIVQLTSDIKSRDDKHEAFQLMVMGKLLTIEGEIKNTKILKQ